MKLRNLLFATMFACAFASCSSDDDPTIDPTPAEAADAYLNITATAKGELTKASDKNALEGEADVKTLAVIVFKDENRIGYQFAELGKEGDKTESFYQKDGSYTLNTPVKVKAVDVDVYVVANVSDDILSKANTKTSFAALTTDLANQVVESGLVMSSAKHSVSAASLKDKSIDDPFFVNSANGGISIQRVAARVQLTEVNVDFKSDKEQLDVKGAILINVRTNSLLSVDNFDASLDFGTAGSQAFGYGQCGDETYSGGLFAKSTLNTQNDAAFTKKITDAVLNKENTTKSLDVTKADAVYSYVMPNALTSVCQEAIDGDGKAYTLLSIYGEYTDNTGQKMAGTRYYTVRIGKDGVEGGAGSVVRNYVYDVKATLTGSGSDSPVNPEAKAYINATINVTPWTVINQTPSVD